MESLTIMTRSSRSKKLEVKGGFYSKEDMKTELGYSQNLACVQLNPVMSNGLIYPPLNAQPRSRIEKIVAWAEKKGLVRLLGTIGSFCWVHICFENCASIS